MDATRTLSDVEIRATLEDFGIIKPPKLPRIDVLLDAVKERRGAVAVSEGARGASASVTLSGREHQGLGDTPARAVAVALTKALLAEPQQASLFDDGDELDDEMKSRLRVIAGKRRVDPETGEIL